MGRNYTLSKTGVSFSSDSLLSDFYVLQHTCQGSDLLFDMGTSWQESLVKYLSHAMIDPTHFLVFGYVLPCVWLLRDLPSNISI